MIGIWNMNIVMCVRKGKYIYQYIKYIEGEGVIFKCINAYFNQK